MFMIEKKKFYTTLTFKGFLYVLFLHLLKQSIPNIWVYWVMGLYYVNIGISK